MKQIKYVLAAVIILISLGGGFYVVDYLTERANKAEEIRKSEEALKQKIQELCKAGLELDWTKDYKAALSKFQEADKLSPGNKEITDYINMITALIKQEEASVKVPPKEEPPVKVPPKEEPPVKVPPKEELALKEQEEKELQEARTRELAQRREQELRQNSQELYKSAIALYRAKDYDAALAKFWEVQGVAPDYEKTAYYIKKISKVIERKETAIKAREAKEAKAALTRKAKELYKSALELYRAKDYNAAHAKFREITVNTPGYGKTIYYIKNISEIIEYNKAAKKAQEARKAKAALTRKAKELYKSARELYWAGDYNAALAKFREVQGVLPDYGKTSEYLREMPGLIKRQEKAPKVRQDITPRAVGKVRDFELEDKLAKRYVEAQKALGEFEIKRTETEKREFLSQIILEIDKLLGLAKEAEKKQNYEMAAEFCEKILTLTSEEKMRRIISDQKERWAQEARKARRKKEARADSPAKTKSVAAGTAAVAQKEERAVEAAAEHEEVAAEVAVSREAATPEPATPEPEELYFTLDFSQRIAAGEYLVEQGEKLLEEKKFKEAYRAFSKAIEVMD